ncbi:hypothetical protein THIOKS1670017 [Thiocapsa sp. KS1]|nr:hypothetical protein THIOKS1670017 [Thiocapsa sp. KS1]
MRECGWAIRFRRTHPRVRSDRIHHQVTGRDAPSCMTAAVGARVFADALSLAGGARDVTSVTHLTRCCGRNCKVA